MLVLSGCAALPKPMPGVYLETRANTILLTSRELILYPDGRAQYLVHTDNMSMSRQGSGTYQLRGRRLELLLNGLPDTATTRTIRTPLPTTDQRLRFYVRGRESNGKTVPLSNLTVLVSYATTGKVVDSEATDSTGYAEISWRPADNPQLIEIEGIGWQKWQHHWPAGPAAFRVQLPPQPYTTYAAGTRKLFRVLAVSPQRLVLRQGSDTLTLVRQP